MKVMRLNFVVSFYLFVSCARARMKWISIMSVLIT